MFFMLTKILPTDQKQVFAAMVWSIWKHRNLKVWEDKNEVVATVVEHARIMISDWQIGNLSSPNELSAAAAGSAVFVSTNYLVSC
jgi:hypothetical protein